MPDPVYIIVAPHCASILVVLRKGAISRLLASTPGMITENMTGIGKTEDGIPHGRQAHKTANTYKAHRRSNVCGYVRLSLLPASQAWSIACRDYPLMWQG